MELLLVSVPFLVLGELSGTQVEGGTQARKQPERWISWPPGRPRSWHEPGRRLRAAKVCRPERRQRAERELQLLWRIEAKRYC